jgi:hypothetical protein
VNWERVWKGNGGGPVNLLFSHLSGGTGETLSQNSQYPVRDSNRALSNTILECYRCANVLDDIWSNLICYAVFAEAILFCESKQNVTSIYS